MVTYCVCIYDYGLALRLGCPQRGVPFGDIVGFDDRHQESKSVESCREAATIQRMGRNCLNVLVVSSWSSTFGCSESRAREQELTFGGKLVSFRQFTR